MSSRWQNSKRLTDNQNDGSVEATEEDLKKTYYVGDFFYGRVFMQERDTNVNSTMGYGANRPIISDIIEHGAESAGMQALSPRVQAEGKLLREVVQLPVLPRRCQ